jgi:hypothetical protein
MIDNLFVHNHHADERNRNKTHHSHENEPKRKKTKYNGREHSWDSNQPIDTSRDKKRPKRSYEISVTIKGVNFVELSTGEPAIEVR